MWDIFKKKRTATATWINITFSATFLLFITELALINELNILLVELCGILMYRIIKMKKKILKLILR